MNETNGTASSALPSGTRLGDFELTGVIGEGGFGIVYSARDLTLDRIVAIKEYLPASLAQREADGAIGLRSQEHSKTFKAGLASFLNEAKLLAKFSHPGLVEVYRFWEANGTAYMVMRYYRGVTLREVMRTNPQIVTEQWLCETLDPILLALRELHHESCYHRDIAPDNIMVLPSGRSVLMDFGAARRIIGGITQALTTVLKPGYAPIEQYAEDGSMLQGAWTDVYAIGGVLYHAMTGKIPVQAISRMMNDPLKPVGELTQQRFSANLSDVVMKCLAVLPGQRYQSIDELRAALGWVTPATGSTVLYQAREQGAVGAASKVAATVGGAPVPATGPAAQTTGSVEAKIATTVAAPVVTIKESQVGSEQTAIADLLSPTSDAAASQSLSSLLDDRTVVSTVRVSAPITTNAPGAGNAPITVTAAASVPSEPTPPPTPTSSDAAPSSAPSSDLQGGPPPSRKRAGPFLVAAAAAVLLMVVALVFIISGGYRGSSTLAKNEEKSATQAVPAASGTPAPAARDAPLPAATPSAASPAAMASAPVDPKVQASAAPAGATAAVAVAPPPSPPSPAIGRLDLRIKPWGNVTVDGVAQGASPPLKQLKLPAGSHEVTLENPGSTAVTKTVEIVADKSVVVSHVFR